MLTTIKRALASIALLGMGGLLAAPASAATFDFTGNVAQSIFDTPSKSFTEDGITVTVTSGTFSSGSNPSAINFNTRLVDLDVFDGLGADGLGDGDDVDGSFGNDVLVFTFSQLVKIERIIFGNVDGNDDFAFGSVSGSLFDRIVDFEDVSNAVLVSSFASMGEATGTSFGIGAIGRFDDFSIKGIEVAAVPIPAALPLFLSGLFGMGWWTRRRRNLSATA